VSNSWSATTDWETVCKRSAGRRRYNAWRTFKKEYRRKQVAELLAQYGLLDHGVQARMARELGVHKSVISRDVQFLLTQRVECPCCGSLVPRDRLPPPEYLDRFIPDHRRPVIYEMGKGPTPYSASQTGQDSRGPT
jgi:hypothetical protein